MVRDSKLELIGSYSHPIGLTTTSQASFRTCEPVQVGVTVRAEAPSVWVEDPVDMITLARTPVNVSQVTVPVTLVAVMFACASTAVSIASPTVVDVGVAGAAKVNGRPKTQTVIESASTQVPPNV
jgi:hypothetical protein